MLRRNKNFMYLIMFIILCVLLSVFVLSKYTLVFQHNMTFIINTNTYTYVKEYKRQLIKNMTQLLDDLHIRFCIGHGNLIEYARGKPIYHDDDLDLRFSKEDMGKWFEYCKNNGKHAYKYNLLFDHRFSDVDAQKENGIQVNLLDFENDRNIKAFKKMDIHCDLVANNIKTNVWIVYDIDFNNLRKVSYLGVDTYVPSEEDTVRILTKEYGSDYMTPNRRYVFKL